MQCLVLDPTPLPEYGSISSYRQCERVRKLTAKLSANLSWIWELESETTQPIRCYYRVSLTPKSYFSSAEGMPLIILPASLHHIILLHLIILHASDRPAYIRLSCMYLIVLHACMHLIILHVSDHPAST